MYRLHKRINERKPEKPAVSPLGQAIQQETVPGGWRGRPAARLLRLLGAPPACLCELGGEGKREEAAPCLLLVSAPPATAPPTSEAGNVLDFTSSWAPITSQQNKPSQGAN